MCTKICETCPTQVNAPLTYEGWQVWDLVQRVGGQIRVAGSAVVGLDMTAIFALSSALAIPNIVVAEILPAIEPIILRKMNEAISAK